MRKRGRSRGRRDTKTPCLSGVITSRDMSVNKSSCSFKLQRCWFPTEPALPTNWESCGRILQCEIMACLAKHFRARAATAVKQLEQEKRVERRETPSRFGTIRINSKLKQLLPWIRCFPCLSGFCLRVRNELIFSFCISTSPHPNPPLL